MSNLVRTQLDELMTHIEENWRNLNVLFEDLESTNGWEQKHGPDWTFADLPYHLAYCNRDLVIRGMEAGADLPENEQELLTSIEALNNWNARKFSLRPTGQTPAQSVSQWSETCEEIRHLITEMTDSDLDRAFWMPLFAGWSNVRDGLEFTCSHDWSEFMQLRIHMGREEPVPSADVTRAYLKRMLAGYPLFFNQEAAGSQRFTAVMKFSDPGVGAFTIRVIDGAADFIFGELSDADLVMTQSATTFLKTISNMHDPVAAIQSGLVQVSNFESLATFGKLFPM